mmetsp:Transcript_17834/g.30425  ORF Transcript_17834/g.30425 Transcript_17834/m.30425 type:complete len:381 (-) Transcript_17834:1133-2275(-)
MDEGRLYINGEVLRRNKMNSKLWFVDVQAQASKEYFIFRRQDFDVDEEFPTKNGQIKVGDVIVFTVCKTEERETTENESGFYLLRYACAWKWLSNTGRKPEPFTKSPNPNVQAICRDYFVKGICNGDTSVCKFRHFLLNELEEARVKKLCETRDKVRAYAEREKNSYLGDGHGTNQSPEAKGLRSTIFADWLLATFGVEVLSQGRGVLDVAGGKGLNAIRLLLSEACPADLEITVVDPQPRGPIVKKVAKALRKRNARPPNFIAECFDYDFLLKEEYKSLVENCSCIIGMHPDQATGYIADIALRYKKPFAIVPCCVFSSEFPERFTPDGKPVETLNDLVSWLCSKHPEIQVDYLPIEGRNKLIYLTPQAYLPSQKTIDN